MNRPKVSVIIPCYGVEKYLDRCLMSVVNQTFKDIEIILVDDASPDRVPEMCDEWSKKDARIVVIHKEKNEGLGMARNTGLDVARGEYVAFIDSDDYVDTKMYYILYEATESGRYDVVYSGLRNEYPDGSFGLIRDFDEERSFKRNEMVKVALSFISKTEICYKDRFFMSVWHSLYKKDIIDEWKLRFYSEREILSEDLPFQVEFCMKASNAKFIPYPLYTYCLNQNSITHNFKIDKFCSAIRLRNLMLNITDKYTQSRPLIDAEYYSRIRNLLTMLVFARNFSIREKYSFISSLCMNSIWDELDMSCVQTKTWKYIEQYQLLKSNAPLMLMLFCAFDKIVNKKNLLSIFRPKK